VARGRARASLGLLEDESGNGMVQLDGITHEGLKTALSIKENYKKKEPICVPGDQLRILMPESLMNRHLDLQTIDDPLALAMMATRDPEAPMALAAAARLSPMGSRTELLSGVYGIVGDTSRHDMVKKCISLISEDAFSPDTIARVWDHTAKLIVRSRAEYSSALRKNLQGLLDGSIAPRKFVLVFFELTEAGNMRHEIRKRLVTSLLLSETVRPSIKFLFLENLDRFPQAVRRAVFSSVLAAEPSHHMDIIKDELRWIIGQERQTWEPPGGDTPVAQAPAGPARQAAADPSGAATKAPSARPISWPAARPPGEVRWT